MDDRNGEYSEQETARRRDATARVLLRTPPHPNWWPTNVRKKASKSKTGKKRAAKLKGRSHA
jgi:hypothetical protein